MKLFLPYFYRKTYTNLLIFVLFFCSFLTLQSFLYSVFNDQTFTSLRCKRRRISLGLTTSPLRERYSSTFFALAFALGLVGTSGLEPPTSRLSGARSNHLSYAPSWFIAVPFIFCLLKLSLLVEMKGIEPLTPCLQGRCSPSWATPPWFWVSTSHRSLKIEQQVN